jgi:4,5-dihydroxyphthalate decarboxylase
LSSKITLNVAIGQYPATEALLSGRLKSNLFEFNFEKISPINRAFAPMVRDARFDVSEMAIATIFQALAYNKPLTPLPVVLAARSQESALLCLKQSLSRGPAALAGTRIGVRAYSQTTGMWIRGILADDWNIHPRDIRWITFEDAHVGEYRDPPWTERAARGKDMLAMLKQGEIDAIIVGNDPPVDPELRCVFENPGAVSNAFHARHALIPINHMLTIKRDLARQRPDIVCELIGLFEKSAAMAIERSTAPHFTQEKIDAGLTLALRFAQDQNLLPTPVTFEEFWAGSRLQ